MTKQKPSLRFSLKNETPFPSVGEAVKAFFKSTGLWSFGTGYESVQKKINRFAKEETILTHAEIQQLINDRLELVFRNELHQEMAESFVFMILGEYQRIISDEATWLNRSETLSWCIKDKSLVSICLLINRLKLVYLEEHYVTGRLYFPKDRHWFLPRYENGKWTMPARGIIAWWINDAVGSRNVSQLCDGPLNGVISSDTIHSWMRTGLKPVKPDIKSLLLIEEATFSTSDESNKKRSLIVLLMVANLVADLTLQVISSIGKTGTLLLLDQLRNLDQAFEQNEGKIFRASVPKALEMVRSHEDWKKEAPPKRRDLEVTMLVGASGDWIRNIGGLYNEHIRASIQKSMLIDTNRDGFVRDALRFTWSAIKESGERSESAIEIFKFSHKAQQLLNRIKPQQMDKVPEEDRIAVANMRNEQGLVGSIKYYCDYLEARIALIDKDYETALTCYGRSFSHARYKAGSLQIKIAEEFTVFAAELYRRDASFENAPNLPMLKYLFNWFRLMDFQHGLAADRTDDALKFAYDRYIELFEMQYVAKDKIMRKVLLNRHKFMRE